MRLGAALVGPRVRVREHTPADLDAFHAWRGDPVAMRYLPWRSRSRAESRAALADAIAQQRLSERARYFFAVDLAGTGDRIGDVGFDLRPDGEAGFGWFLRPEWWGRGLATEAARLTIDFAFARVGVAAVVASCDARNRASERVMQKCGLVRVGASPRRDEATARLHYRRERPPR